MFVIPEQSYADILKTRKGIATMKNKKEPADRKSHFDDNKSNYSEDDLHTSRNDYHDNKYASFAAEPRIRFNPNLALLSP